MASSNDKIIKSISPYTTKITAGDGEVKIEDDIKVSGTTTSEEEVIIKNLSLTPTSPAAGYTKYYPKIDGKTYQLSSAGTEVELGAGEGGGGGQYKNFISLNADNETGLTALTTGSHANVGDGDGSESGTLELVTAGLIDTSDIQNFKFTQSAGSLNDYIYIQGKVDEKRETGAKLRYQYDGNDDDLSIVYRCTTSGDVIREVPLKATVETVSFVDAFVVPAGCGELKFSIQVKVENTGAVFTFNRITVTDNARLIVKINEDTEWEEYSLAIGATTTAPTKGSSIAFDKAYWRRIGDSIQISYSYLQNGVTGTAAGNGIYLFPLPAGVEVDSEKIISAANTGMGVVGPASYRAQNIVANGYVKIYNSTNLSLELGNAATEPDAVKSSFFAIINDNSGYSFFATIPIKGWRKNSENLITPVTNVPNTYSARIQNNGTASIISQRGSFIDSVSRTAAGKVTVNFVAGLFTVAPSVTVTVENPNNSSNPHVINPDSISTSGFNIISQDNSASSGVYADLDFAISVERQGSDVKNSIIEAAIPLPELKEIARESNYETAAITLGVYQIPDTAFKIDLSAGTHIITINGDAFLTNGNIGTLARQVLRLGTSSTPGQDLIGHAMNSVSFAQSASPDSDGRSFTQVITLTAAKSIYLNVTAVALSGAPNVTSTGFRADNGGQRNLTMQALKL